MMTVGLLRSMSLLVQSFAKKLSNNIQSIVIICWEGRSIPGPKLQWLEVGNTGYAFKTKTYRKSHILNEKNIFSFKTC